MRPSRFAVAVSLMAALGACPGEEPTGAGGGGDDGGELTIYCGRSKAMVHGLFDAFTAATGIKLNVRYADTTGLANTIIEEGEASPADVFFAQDAGALGALHDKGLLVPLPEATLARVDPRFRGAAGTWVGVSGRARVVAYNTDRVKVEELPESLDGFAEPRWKGRIGWPPTNASFQAFVSALRLARGDDRAVAWLEGIKRNEPRPYPKNSAALQAVARGEVDVAFVNHYYLHTVRREAGDAPFPVANYHPPGDLGAMMNVAGVGVLASSKARERAERLVAFLLSEEAQRTFASDNFEYPLAAGISAPDGVTPIAELKLPTLDLGALYDLEGTLAVLRRAGVLP